MTNMYHLNFTILQDDIPFRNGNGLSGFIASCNNKIFFAKRNYGGSDDEWFGIQDMISELNETKSTKYRSESVKIEVIKNYQEIISLMRNYTVSRLLDGIEDESYYTTLVYAC